MVYQLAYRHLVAVLATDLRLEELSQDRFREALRYDLQTESRSKIVRRVRIRIDDRSSSELSAIGGPTLDRGHLGLVRGVARSHGMPAFEIEKDLRG